MIVASETRAQYLPSWFLRPDCIDDSANTEQIESSAVPSLIYSAKIAYLVHQQDRRVTMIRARADSVENVVCTAEEAGNG